MSQVLLSFFVKAFLSLSDPVLNVNLILFVLMFRFKLNHNSNRLLPGEKNHSIWVGDLTPEVDDLQLYRFFSARFQSIVSAKGK